MACIITNYTLYKCNKLEQQLRNIIRQSQIWACINYTQFIEDCRSDYKLFNYRYASDYDTYNKWTHFIRKISRVNHIKYLNTMTQVRTSKYIISTKTILTKWYPNGKMKELMTEKDYTRGEDAIKEIIKISWDRNNISSTVQIKVINNDWDNAIYK